MADYRLDFERLLSESTRRADDESRKCAATAMAPPHGFKAGYSSGFWAGSTNAFLVFGAQPYYRTARCALLRQSYTPDDPAGLVLPGPSPCTPRDHPQCHRHCRRCWQEGYEAGVARAIKSGFAPTR